MDTRDHNGVEPTTRAFLEALEVNGGPPLSELSVDAARTAFAIAERKQHQTGKAPRRVGQGQGDPDSRAGEVITNAELKVYRSAPHGLCATLKDQVNADLLAFCKA